MRLPIKPRQSYRSVYGYPWASPHEVSKTLGINPDDLRRAREFGILKEVRDYRIAGRTRGRRRTFVYDIERIREGLPFIQELLRRSYVLSRSEFEQMLLQLEIAAKAAGVVEGEPTARMPPAPGRQVSRSTEKAGGRTASAKPRQPEAKPAPTRAPEGWEPRYEAERPFCGPPLPPLGDSGRDDDGSWLDDL